MLVRLICKLQGALFCVDAGYVADDINPELSLRDWHDAEQPMPTAPNHHPSDAAHDGSAALPMEAEHMQFQPHINHDSANTGASVQLASNEFNQYDGGTERASIAHQQAHWQDNYASSWNRVNATGGLSHSEAATAALQAMDSAAQQVLEGDDACTTAGSKGGKQWVCKLCTYSENPMHLLRCAICDTLKGTEWQSMLNPDARQHEQHKQTSPPASASAAGSQHKQAWATAADNAQHSKPKLHGRGTKPGGKAGAASQRGIASFFGNKHSTQTKAECDAEQASHVQTTINAAHSYAQISVHPSTLTDVVWLEYDSDFQKWQCGKCSQWFAENQKDEHQDYHFALELSCMQSNTQLQATHKQHSSVSCS